MILAWGNPEIPMLVLWLVGFFYGYIVGAKWWMG